MDMADKLFEDDDIIDLTDLLEEGDASKKSKGKKDDGAGVRTPANEPDSFDLGKEISMEYDVSVEEIEHSGETIDIDASLSQHEEVALTQEKEVEVKVGDDGLDLENIEKDLTPDVQPESDRADISSGGSKENAKEDTYAISEEMVEQESDLTVKEGAETKIEDEILDSAPVSGDIGSFDMDKIISEEPKQEPVAAPESLGVDMEVDVEPLHPVVPPQVTAKDIEELRQEVPVMLEAIVRPLMSELVREMISATREQLPGIVEKVIREEIEKLKKLDS